jgi:hypothetical protein
MKCNHSKTNSQVLSTQVLLCLLIAFGSTTAFSNMFEKSLLRTINCGIKNLKN